MALLSTLERRLLADVPNGRAAHPRAAVAAVFTRDVHGDDAHVLLIQRAVKESDPWSGHMAFPGGREEPDDESLLRTAVRETREEVGLDLDASAEFLGRMEDVPAVSRGRKTGLVISPFVFVCRTPGRFVLEQAEVSEALWAPVSPLVRGEANTVYPYKRESNIIEMPAFDVQGRIVWGLTYHMLSRMIEGMRNLEGDRRGS